MTYTEKCRTRVAGECNALISGLLRAAGKPTLDQGTGEVELG
jgi:hypothetical protein